MNTKTAKRPVPRPTKTTEPFWEGVHRGKLMLQYDPETRAYQFYPRAGSLRTGKRNLEWREASGRGTIYSVTETYVPMPGFEDRGTYLLAMIDLEEGVRILANLVNVTAEDAVIGLPVRVAFEKIGENADYFCFEPDTAR